MTATVAPIRPVTFGGSSIAAAAGIDPYRSRFRLWHELTTGAERDEENEHTRIGNALEPVVVGMLPEYGYEVAKYPVGGLYDKARPWLVGHPDALVADGSMLVAEVKVTGGWARRNWREGRPPLTWQAQVQTYMYLADVERSVIAALIDGTHLETVEVRRDERAMTLLLGKADEFYGYVCRNEPPPFDGHDDERETLHALFAAGTKGRKVRASREVAAVVDEFRRLARARETLDRQMDERRRMIEATMGDAETLVGLHDEELVKWTTSTTRRVSTKRLREEYPDLYETLAEPSTSRRFTVA